MKTNYLKVLVALILIASSLTSYAQTLAFPTAEGYGKYVTGGRGGVVYEVTNLNATGSGSLGAAISASGKRIVVFRVSGTISGDFNIKNGDITIAGQTAPGDGICIKGNLSTSADNIIIRYIRVRHDPAIVGDALGGRFHKNIIFDHISTSWSADEVLTLYHNENTTVQWCIISEGCEKFENGVSVGHRFGGIWGNKYGTWHHNLIAHNDSRNPRWASGCGYNDYRNNVIYNWGYESSYGGEKDQPNTPEFSGSYINMIGNYYKPGPATIANVSAAKTIAQPSARSSTDKGDWFVSGNYFDGQSDITSDNWKGVLGSNYNKLSAAWSAMPIKQQSPQDAYASVLDKTGCSFPKRDKVDADIVNDVRTGTAKYGKNGIVSKPSDVGGWPTLVSSTAPADADHDGMPDAWELANGLNPNNANDRNNIGAGGYTMVEIYINSLVDEATPTVSVTGVSVSPATSSVIVGATTQLSATIAPSNATNKTVSWSSSNTAVATVNASGLVTGVAAGSATISVTTQDGSKTATASITITASSVSVTGVSVSPATASVNVGATIQLTATIAPSNATNKTVTWSSSNTAVATVSATGLVSGVAAGTATITVTTQDGSKKATSAFTIITNGTSAPTALIKLGFNENSGTSVSNTGTVSATFTKSGVPTWSTNVPTNGGSGSVDFGTTVGNNYVESSALISQLSGLTSFTITGWVNCKNATVGSGGNRIVSWIKNGANGVDVVYLADGSLKIGINQWPDASSAVSSTGKITTNSSASASNWKFFAITYQSATGAVQYYFGDNATQASLDKTLTYSKGAVGTSIGKLAIGHFNSESSRTTRTDRMFRGLIDQVGIYGSALTLADIQAIQNLNGSNTAKKIAEKVEESSDSAFNFYPNPVESILTIDLGTEFISEGGIIELFDFSGKLVMSEDIKNNKNLTLNMATLPSGVYMLKISNLTSKLTRKVIKK